MRRTYVGYDLGDTETITDVVTLEEGGLSIRATFNNITMFFIRNVISEVFDDIPADLMKYDVDPSRIVSKGLTLAAVHRYTTPLVRDICLIEERIGSIIERGFPVLLEDFEKIILPVAGQAIRKRIDEWKTGEISTLD